MFLFVRLLMPSLAYFGLVLPGNAHIGHLGDLAGHSHWLGVGAVIVAGALAGLVGKLHEAKAADDSEEDADEPEVEGNPA